MGSSMKRRTLTTSLSVAASVAAITLGTVTVSNAFSMGEQAATTLDVAPVVGTTTGTGPVIGNDDISSTTGDPAQTPEKDATAEQGTADGTATDPAAPADPAAPEVPAEPAAPAPAPAPAAPAPAAPSTQGGVTAVNPPAPAPAPVDDDDDDADDDLDDDADDGDDD